MKKKLIVIISASVCAIIAVTFAILAFCGVFSGNKELPPISFTEKRIEMLLDNTKQLSLEGLEKNEKVTYSSSDEKIATVDKNGLVTAKGIGSAIIKATTDDDRSALTQINVHDPKFYPIPYIGVNKTEITLTVGDSYTVDYTYTYLTETVLGEVVFESANSSVVSVDGGKIVAVGVGETTVTLKGSSSFGDAQTVISVTVIAEQTEFYLSISGKDLFVGSQYDLEVYSNENGAITEIENASFTSEDQTVLSIDGKVANPLLGGETFVNATFDYKGKTEVLRVSVYVYGVRKCTVKFIDGTVNHVVDAYYNDKIQLKIENPLGNPEYENRKIKYWYLNGERLDTTTFTMPDEDVEVIAVYENETDDNFIDSFGAGHLVNDEQSTVEFINETFSDDAGNSSLLGGYVKLTSQQSSSLSYYFDEPVLVRKASYVKFRVYIPNTVLLAYFGVATDVKCRDQQSNPDFPLNSSYTLRYEATVHRNQAHLSGRVPGIAVDENKWITIQMPLSAFAKVGEKLSGISIAANGSNYILIDSISLHLGLEETDLIYYDKLLYNTIIAETNGSSAQLKVINEYRNWALGLTQEERSSAVHQQNVAAINDIISQYYSTDTEEKLSNIAKITGLGLNVADYRTVSTGGVKNDFKSRTYTNFNYTQMDAGESATFTLPATDYSQYKEVSFGIFGIIAEKGSSVGQGTLTVNGEQIQIETILPSNYGYYYKVVIKDSVLTVYDDSKNGSGEVVLTMNLTQDVYNGKESIVITYTGDAWSQVEVTEAYATSSVNPVT